MRFLHKLTMQYKPLLQCLTVPLNPHNDCVNKIPAKKWMQDGTDFISDQSHKTTFQKLDGDFDQGR